MVNTLFLGFQEGSAIDYDMKRGMYWKAVLGKGGFIVSCVSVNVGPLIEGERNFMGLRSYLLNRDNTYGGLFSITVAVAFIIISDKFLLLDNVVVKLLLYFVHE